MKKSISILFALAMTFLTWPNNSLYAAPIPVPLDVAYNDPTYNQTNPHRSPILIPEVSLDGYTLTFDDSCIGCTLRLVNAEGEVEYTTIITSDTLVLPSTLEGEFEIQIIRDNWCFYGYIEL